MNTPFTMTLFFWLFSSLLLGSALFVIYSDNAVYSALSLVVVFLNAGLLLLILDLEFLAVIFVLIYIGAIMVLILFVVMLLDINPSPQYLKQGYYSGFSGVLLGGLAVELIYSIKTDFFSLLPEEASLQEYGDWCHVVLEMTTLQVFGQYLYTQYGSCVFIAGVLLLVAMIGAISVTFEEVVSEDIRKQQYLFQQVQTLPKEVLFYVK